MPQISPADVIAAVTPFLSAPVLLFFLFGLGAVAAAIMMVVHPNPVRAALFLVLNLFCVAVTYLLLNSFFLATVQIVVYTGAIMVLFLFVIMLLNLGTPDRTVDRLRWQQPVALAGGLLLALVLGWTIAVSTPTPIINPRNDAMGTVAGVGTDLYDPAQPWLFPFEMTSILLLVAVIGSVVLALRRAPVGEDLSGAETSAGGMGGGA